MSESTKRPLTTNLSASYSSGETTALDYDDWLNLNEDNLTCEAAESGSDRELDYDRERFAERAYDRYEKSFSERDLDA